MGVEVSKAQSDAPHTHTFLLEIEADGVVNVKPLYDLVQSEVSLTFQQPKKFSLRG